MKVHPILKGRRFESFIDLEKEIERLPTTKDKGDAFEDFVYLFLTLNKTKYQIEELYRIQDAPQSLLSKLSIESWDAGVDGLFVLKSGLVAAYQAKFRSDRKKPSYDELTKFWAESRNADLKYTIANCFGLTKLTKKESRHLEILAQEFDKLEVEFFSQIYELSNQKRVSRVLFKPYEFQEEIIENVIKGFANSNRGKFISACGTGKTLTSLWITENLNANNVLFLAPSIALIKQTLEEWAKQSKEPFHYLCICSDNTVNREVEDYGDIAINNLDIPVTTDIELISRFLRQSVSERKITFCTYQSLNVLSDAVLTITGHSFDFAIFDEAHRTAGVKFSSLFNLALDDENVSCEKRLFMTATERMLTPRLIGKAEEEDRVVFSMDDESVYGETFHRLKFGEAIQLGIISDYQVVVGAIREEEVYHWIVENSDLEDDEDISTNAEVIFTRILLSKSIKSYNLTKTITFHSSINNSKLFTGSATSGINLQSLIAEFNDNIDPTDLYIDHIDGSYSAERRNRILESFKTANYGVVSNSRCLTEGVDVPEIDSIYFVDPKNSLIDIVQAIGRALRISRKKDKIATILLPILIPEGIDEEEVFNSDRFESVYNIVQSLRDQDNRLEQWIDMLNRNVARGRYVRPPSGPIEISIPESFDLRKFEKNLLTRIAIRNGESSSKKNRRKKKYGFKGRVSSYKRLFRTMGDYSVASYKSSLVEPTLDKMVNEPNSLYKTADIKVNNNNVSHTYRIGLIQKHSGRTYSLAPLGLDYIKSNIDFEDLFREQMLKYFIEDKGRFLFPYRALLNIILEVGEINFLHFAYPVCSLYDNSTDSLSECIEGIMLINEEVQNPEFLNETNQKRLLIEFNDLWGVEYRFEDIWTRNTTLNNQWIYFRNHLSYFDFIIQDNSKKTLKVIEDKKEDLIKALQKNKDKIEVADIGTARQNLIRRISMYLFTL